MRSAWLAIRTPRPLPLSPSPSHNIPPLPCRHPMFILTSHLWGCLIVDLYTWTQRCMLLSPGMVQPRRPSIGQPHPQLGLYPHLLRDIHLGTRALANLPQSKTRLRRRLNLSNERPISLYPFPWRPIFVQNETCHLVRTLFKFELA